MARFVAIALAAALAAPALAETPITLDDALARAARANPDLALAREDAATARADVTASRAGVLPRLDLTSSFGHTFTGRAAEPRLIPNPITGELDELGAASDDEAYSLGLQLSQPLFDWEVFRDVGRASSQARAMKAAFVDALASQAAADPVPFELDYWRLDFDATRPR